VAHQLIMALGLVVALGGVAAADDASAAKRYFVSGSKHFDLGEYSDALNDFKEGYRLKDDPVFLYNIAQCHRLLNQNTEALRAYKTYLRRAPNAPNRDEVERKIAAIEEAQAAANKATTTPPNQVLPPDGAHGDASTGTAPAAGTTAGSAQPSTAPAGATTSNSLTATAPPRDEHQPLYKKWWLWTAVGVVAVGLGLGVGLGVGLSKSSSHTTAFPAVQF
jgi:tetratricopeptide (TPR) repeat protein